MFLVTWSANLWGIILLYSGHQRTGQVMQSLTQKYRISKDVPDSQAHIYCLFIITSYSIILINSLATKESTVHGRTPSITSHWALVCQLVHKHDDNKLF